jgi:hypothetical protein
MSTNSATRTKGGPAIVADPPFAHVSQHPRPPPRNRATGAKTRVARRRAEPGAARLLHLCERDEASLPMHAGRSPWRMRTNISIDQRASDDAVPIVTLPPPSEEHD